MYGWIWRKLPGGWPGKLGGSFVLLLAALALLFYVIFPWAEPRLPFNHVTVSPGGSAPSAPGPSVAPSSAPSSGPSSGPSPTTPTASQLPAD
jgi:hypothetical protein